jgi:hypothetical protein
MLVKLVVSALAVDDSRNRGFFRDMNAITDYRKFEMARLACGINYLHDLLAAKAAAVSVARPSDLIAK